MSDVTFVDYISKRSKENELPLWRVDAHLYIDTSTLCKVEKGDRLASPEDLKTLLDILELDLKEVQTTFIASKSIKTLEAWNI